MSYISFLCNFFLCYKFVYYFVCNVFTKPKIETAVMVTWITRAMTQSIHQTAASENGELWSRRSATAHVFRHGRRSIGTAERRRNCGDGSGFQDRVGTATTTLLALRSVDGRVQVCPRGLRMSRARMGREIPFQLCTPGVCACVRACVMSTTLVNVVHLFCMLLL